MGLLDSAPEPTPEPSKASDTPRRELPSDLFRPVPSASEDAQPDALDSITRRLRTETGAPTAPAKPSRAAVVVTWVRSHTGMIAVVAAIAGLAVGLFYAWPYLTSGAATVKASLVSAISNAPPPGTEEQAAAPPEAAPPARARTRRRPAAAVAAESQPEAVSEAGAATTPDVAPSAPAAAAVTAESASGDSSGLAAEPNAPAAPREPVVYSSANRDVQPPKVKSAEIPRTIGGGLPTRTESLELLVNADGTVDRVRLATPNPRMLDPMFLSRAKMWRFEPARRDGEPVPYRLVMSWQVSDR